MKPKITVVGAAIVKDGRILALRRADGMDEVIHKFEFVGGKVEKGESPEEALKRECMEELSLEIEVGDLISKVDYEYPKIFVSLSVYFAKPLSGYVVKEHEEDRWIECSLVDYNEWAPADKSFVQTVKNGFVKHVTVKTEDDFNRIKALANTIFGDIHGETAEYSKAEYILNNHLTACGIAEYIKQGGTFKIVSLNGEDVGFFGYKPAEGYGEGVYVTYAYLKKFARNKKITVKFLQSLLRPVYMKVARSNTQAVSMFKSCGFKILEAVSTDVGGAFVSEDFLMKLN